MVRFAVGDSVRQGVPGYHEVRQFLEGISIYAHVPQRRKPQFGHTRFHDGAERSDVVDLQVPVCLTDGTAETVPRHHGLHPSHETGTEDERGFPVAPP